MIKQVSILGSTGSIGTQTLDICREYNIQVNSLVANSNIDLLAKQAREFSPQNIVIADKSKYNKLKGLLSDTNINILSGAEAIIEIIENYSPDEMVLNALVGMAGLLPTISAIKSRKNIALANKETLVAGGEIVMQLAKEYNVNIFPVDSEHSAIFQSLSGNNPKDLRKIILTASGGPFFGKNKEDLKHVTVEQALNHPNWSMGNKITIDSATMMNKGLEVIEAVHLFNVSADQIEIVIHRESILHSAVEFNDSSVIAQMGEPDMKIPIQYAFTYPKRLKTSVSSLNLAKHKNLTFYEPDMATFSALKICIDAINLGGVAPCIVNAANEVAVDLFLNKKISFLQISELVAKSLNTLYSKDIENNLENILKYDNLSREYVKNNY